MMQQAEKKCADVLIIGAGIIGCAAAYYLAKRGLGVLVLEKSKNIGDGGSSRNGGGVRQSGRDPRELPLMLYTVQNIWPGLTEELGVDVEYCRDGNLRLGKNDEHARVLTNLTEKAVACGLDMQMISGDEAREINPYLSEEVTCASWCPTDGHANPLAATLAFYRAARKNGVRFFTDEFVQSIGKIGGYARRVTTQNGVYEADKILVAAGADSRPVLASVGIDVPVIAQKMETLVTEPMPPMFTQMLGTAAADFYGHQTKDYSFVFGGTAGYELYNRHNGTPVCSSLAAGATCRGIMGYFPALKRAKIVRTWGGWIDTCADGVPVLSGVDEVPGLYLSCAFTGHGFGIGPGAALCMAQMVVGEETAVDLSALRYDRFAAKI